MLNMRLCLFAVCMTQLSISARINDYDGSSTEVIKSGNVKSSRQWEIQYTLPSVCADGSYNIEIELGIRKTSKEADLVFAVGDNLKYFAATNAYDGKIGTDKTKVGSLIASTDTVSGNVATKDVKDWRNTLSNSWNLLNADQTGDMADDISPLTIIIASTAANTFVTFVKGSETNDISYSTTFTGGANPSVYLSADAISDENFVLNYITTYGGCPTSDPTSDPTVDPITDPTTVPTSDPTSAPTSDPTYNCEADLEKYIRRCHCGTQPTFTEDKSVLSAQDMNNLIQQYNEKFEHDVGREMVYMVALFATANLFLWKVFANDQDDGKMLA